MNIAILIISIIAAAFFFPYIIKIAGNTSEFIVNAVEVVHGWFLTYIEEWGRVLDIILGAKFARKRAIKATVKKVNNALKINLTRWQIDFIFYGVTYPQEITKTRANGKTLAHILRIVLKDGHAEVKEPLNLATSCTRNLCFYDRYIGEDTETKMREMYFVEETKSVYMRLKEAGGIELREIIWPRKRQTIVF